MDTPLPLKAPSAVLLSRITGRLTYLYLERCRIEQDDNGTAAVIESDGVARTAYLPAATLTVIMLGPGTSITQAAVRALGQSGCGVVFVGGGAVRAYGAFMPMFASTELLERQAQVVCDPVLREEAARRMFLRRFPDQVADALDGMSIEQLRGMEGARMRAVYLSNAKRSRVKGWKRVNGHDDPIPDGQVGAVNRALNAGSSALYGLVNAVVVSLGLSPGLGVIHTGNRQSFTLDIADLYKSEIVIPTAFRLSGSKDPENEMLRLLRDELRMVRILPRCIEDIRCCLGVEHVQADNWDVDQIFLWGRKSIVTGGWTQPMVL